MSDTAPTAAPAAVDFDELCAQLGVVSHFLSAHGGSIRVESVGDDGVVCVRFEGLCTSCALRPLSLETLVRPALLEVPGVTGVEAAGLRISAKAGARLAAISAAEREQRAVDPSQRLAVTAASRGTAVHRRVVLGAR